MKVFDVPIEPLEERYSSQWARWFYGELVSRGLLAITLTDVPLTMRIEDGAFLDVCGTNYYKAKQLATLVHCIYTGTVTDEDWILFHDLWNPSLVSLQYIRDGSNKRFRIAGCLHAGTWDPSDFLSRKGMARWAKPFERSLLSIADLIFVATGFHRDLICRYFDDSKDTDKIRVTGFPIFPVTTPGIVKDPSLVVFPHRLDPEKRPDLWDAFKKEARKFGLLCLSTKELCKTKLAYYQLLAQATYAVSFAEQETWGIAMQEATFAGCIPLVPDRLSYREMYPSIVRHDGTPTSCLGHLLNHRAAQPGHAMVGQAMANHKYQLLLNGQRAIPNMIQEMTNHAR